MKKFVSILMAIVMMFAMAACSKAVENESGKVEQSITNESDVIEEEKESEAKDAEEAITNEDTTTSTESNESVESKPAENKPAENNNSSDKPATTPKPADNNKPATTPKPEENNKPSETGKPAEANKPSHTHSWKEVYRTDKIEHAAEYEEKPAEYEVYWDCAKFVDGTVINPKDYGFSSSAYKQALHAQQDKLNDQGIQSNYGNGANDSCTMSADQYNSLSWTFYDVTVTKTAKVETKAAWIETKEVLDHYECSCGATM